MMTNFDSLLNAGNEPLLVFGGPYSNLGATRAMQVAANGLGIPPERVICTGDVVAYCAEPEQTVALIRDWGIRVIAGNCEQQLAAGGADCGCGFAEGSACDLLAKGWYPFASARISDSSRNWMKLLPDTLRFTYAGFPATQLEVIPDLREALDRGLDLTRPGRELGGGTGRDHDSLPRDAVFFVERPR